MPPSTYGTDASERHLGWPEEAGKDRRLGTPSRPRQGPYRTQTLAGDVQNRDPSGGCTKHG